MRVIYQKLMEQREKLHLSTRYIANFLKISEEEYEQVENGRQELSEEQLKLLSKVYGVESKYFFLEEVQSNEILARTHKSLTNHDQKQINEFLNFQKYVGKKRSKELVL